VNDTEKLAICERALASEIRAHTVTREHSAQLLEALKQLVDMEYPRGSIGKCDTLYITAAAAIKAAGG